MSLSEDEDDFLSADEGGYEDDQKEVQRKGAGATSKDLTCTKTLQKPVEDTTDVPKVDEVIEKTSKQGSKDKTLIGDIDLFDTSDDDLADKEKCESSSTTSQDNGDDDNGDDEDALAERIRERNLKIARKFSAELARNIKASVPIPVKTSAPVDIKSDNGDTTPVSRTRPGFPPAPPPTPALSSSFNSEETGAGWRAQNKITAVAKTGNPPMDKPKVGQARFALDRLADNFASSDKNLFERVAEDLKKVTIRSDEPASCSNNDQASVTNIPIMSNLSSSLGAWNWGGASNLFASATQVTTQMKSALESVLLPATEEHEPSSSQVKKSS